jgi:hypothetical protein
VDSQLAKAVEYVAGEMSKSAAAPAESEAKPAEPEAKPEEKKPAA